MRRPGNYPSQTILYTLKFQDGLESNVVIKENAIVKFTANKSSGNSFGNNKRHTGKYDEGHEYDKRSNDKFVKYAV